MVARVVTAWPPPRSCVDPYRSAVPLDRYGTDVLSGDWKAPRNGRAVEVPTEVGMVVEEVTTDFCGEVVSVDRDLHVLTLEDRHGKRRTFPLGAGFLIEGRPVVLSAPVEAASADAPKPRSRTRAPKKPVDATPAKEAAGD